MRATHIPRRPKKKPLRGKKVGFAEKKLRLWGVACAPAGGGIEGRAQNIAPLHLMRCLIAGYNLVGALEGRAQNIAPLHVGGIVAVVAIEAIDAIDAIEAIEAIEDMGFWGYGLLGLWAWWDGRDKKVGFAEEKAVSRKKSRLRRKKTAPTAFLNHEFIKEVSYA